VGDTRDPAAGRMPRARVAPFSRPSDAAPEPHRAAPQKWRVPRPFAGPTAHEPDLVSPAAVMVIEAEPASAWAVAAVAIVAEPLPIVEDTSVVDEPVVPEPAHEEVLVLDTPMSHVEEPAVDEADDAAAHVARRLEALASRVRCGEIGVAGVDEDASDPVMLASLLTALLRGHH
jgi:hypothetical protein